MYSVKLPIAIFAAALMSIAMVAQAESADKHAHSTLVLDIKITGDSSVAGDAEDNLLKIAKFSEHLRQELQDKTRFVVIDDADDMAKVAAAAENEDLHRCNGCERALAREVGAGYVMLPSVFRMSHLISTLHIEVTDAESGTLLKRKAYDFRGNTDNAWERAIRYAIRDLEQWQPR
ncbi:hypothetical protein MPL1_00225 [Methylophaga lonarensis MPL]|uniref:DUF2380 domain-containing protein n=1 Tax=Methylophaga lonarensis MPL TaxID=1286106 RepID=M7PKI1_9GAMM|nr:DUF2380 domain-containing protein [Methylophaga lonarensis]EMR14375.1 hypothetical protein MPL1_00225 [Methylophaga lonarensis MPL]